MFAIRSPLDIHLKVRFLSHLYWASSLLGPTDALPGRATPMEAMGLNIGLLFLGGNNFDVAMMVTHIVHFNGHYNKINKPL